MRDEPRDPSLESLFDLHRETLLDALRIHLPGVITAYDQVRQTASVQPEIQQGHLDEDGVTRIVKTLPIIHDCPVQFPGSGPNRTTYPVAIGHTCTVMWCSSAIARWVVLGGTIDPEDDRHCDYNDAIVLVGLNGSNPPTDAPTDAVVHHVAAGVPIKFVDSSADQPVVIQPALDDFMSALDTGINAMTLAGDPAVSALAALKTALLALNSSFGWKAKSLQLLAVQAPADAII